MPDDKTTKVPETAAPDTGPGKHPDVRGKVILQPQGKEFFT